MKPDVFCIDVSKILWGETWQATAGEVKGRIQGFYYLHTSSFENGCHTDPIR